ncbi:MAG: hypothetical protein J7L26_04100 [Candidatus Aminicenantes bacterium]|nr:hypothetical protein [Candidatus Aminicenantes bacterium]
MRELFAFIFFVVAIYVGSQVFRHQESIWDYFIYLFVVGVILWGAVGLLKNPERRRSTLPKPKTCALCGARLSPLSSSKYCRRCYSRIKAQLPEVQQKIIQAKSIDDNTSQIIKKLSKKDAIKLFEDVYQEFMKDSELDIDELEVLQKIQEIASLSEEEVKSLERLLFYVLFSSAKKFNMLPPFNSTIDLKNVVLKKNESIHYGALATFYELRKSRKGYRGGMGGASVELSKGFSLQIGAHGGEIEEEYFLIESSSGFLLITNQRLLLLPMEGKRLVNLPLDKIVYYRCYRNGLEIFRDNEKAYFFKMKFYEAKIFYFCLRVLFGKFDESLKELGRMDGEE